MDIERSEPMNEYSMLEEAVRLFLNLDEESKAYVVDLLKSEAQPDGSQVQSA